MAVRSTRCARSIPSLKLSLRRGSSLTPRQRSHIPHSIEVLDDLLSWRYSARAAKISPSSSTNHRSAFKRAIAKAAVHLRHAGVRRQRQISALYTPFDPVRANPETCGSAEELDARERELLRKLCDTLRRGRFHLLSNREFVYSLQSTYRNTLPVEVDFDAYDARLLRDLSETLYEPAAQRYAAPPTGGAFLIFHRGVTVDRTVGFFFSEKVDELVHRMSGAIRRRWRSWRGHGMEPPPQAVDAEAPPSLLHNALVRLSSSVPSEWRPERFERVLAEARRLKAERAVAVATRIMGGGEERDPQLHAALRSRRSLHDIRLGPLRFLRRVTLQEPAFTEVVAIYRKSPAWADPPLRIDPSEWSIIGSDNDDETRTAKGAAPPSIETLLRLNERNLYVRHFHHIPLADLGLLLPGKTTSIRPADRVRFSFASIIAISVSLPLVFMPNPKFSVAWVAAFVASASYLARMASRLYSAKVYYSTLTSSMLSERLTCSGSPALSFLVHDAYEQQAKEISVVYSVLCDATLAALGGSIAPTAIGGPPGSEANSPRVNAGGLCISEILEGCQRTLIDTGVGWPQHDRIARLHDDRSSGIYLDRAQVLPALRVLCDLGMCEAVPRAASTNISEVDQEASFSPDDVEVEGYTSAERSWALQAENLVFVGVLPPRE